MKALVTILFLSLILSAGLIEIPQSDKEFAINALKEKGIMSINGYYLKCGEGPYDWIYVDITKDVGYKFLENGSFDGAHPIKGNMDIDFNNKAIIFDALSTTGTGDTLSCKNNIENKTVDYNAYYVKYGTNPNDWAYVDNMYGSVKGEISGIVFKFEGKDFAYIQKKDENFLNPINTDGKMIIFGGELCVQSDFPGNTLPICGSSNSSSSASYYHLTDVSGVHASIDINNSIEADDLYFCPNHNFKVNGTDEDGEFTDYGTWSIVDGKIVINDPDGTSTITLYDAPQVHATGSIVSNDGTDTFTITSLVSGVTNDVCENNSSSSSSSASSSEGSSSSSGLEMPPTPPDLNSSSSSGGVDMPPSPPQI